MKKFNYIVKSSDSLDRIDKFLAKLLVDNLSRNQIKQLINERCLVVNGNIKLQANYLVNVGDKIELSYNK
jgi:23S rRNA-/tRNA-specific pseudouridylate synthase